MAVGPFWVDLGERTIRAFAQGMVGALGVTAIASPVTSLPWVFAAEVGASAAVFSILTGFAALKVGDGQSASLVPPMKALFLREKKGRP